MLSTAKNQQCGNKIYGVENIWPRKHVFGGKQSNVDGSETTPQWSTSVFFMRVFATCLRSLSCVWHQEGVTVHYYIPYTPSGFSVLGQIKEQIRLQAACDHNISKRVDHRDLSQSRCLLC